MRAYSASDEETVRARDLLKDWAGEGFLTAEQYQQMEPDTVCDLRRTNIFLRIVLFLFTLLIVGAAVALFFVAFSKEELQLPSIFLLTFAALSYAAAELAVSRFRLYRFGIEEALAAGSVGLLSIGIAAANPGGTDFLIPAAGAMASLWILRRFGFAYALPAAMIFAIWLPDHWTSSPSAQRLIVAAIYAAGLITIVAARSRYRLTYLDGNFSIAEAALWLGMYLAINLQLMPRNLLAEWWSGIRTTAEFSRPFYWATWVLTWLLPPIVLARGLRLKDRFVIAAGALIAILTLATNKPYLGWPRHTWDPMLLGALLIGVALFLRRWLADGPGETRHGFTARRLSGKDKRRMNAGISAFGLVSPNMITPSPQPSNPDIHFGGGESGGGGASSDF